MAVRGDYNGGVGPSFLRRGGLRPAARTVLAGATVRATSVKVQTRDHARYHGRDPALISRHRCRHVWKHITLVRCRHVWRY
eukprot:3513362-Rhodomonas_salina.7